MLEHDDVDHESERSELVLLTCLVALSDPTEPAVEHVPGEPVAAFAPVEDAVDVSPVNRVVAVGEDVQGLDDPAEFDEGSGEAGGVGSSLQGAHDR